MYHLGPFIAAILITGVSYCDCQPPKQDQHLWKETNNCCPTSISWVSILTKKYRFKPNSYPSNSSCKIVQIASAARLRTSTITCVSWSDSASLQLLHDKHQSCRVILPCFSTFAAFVFFRVAVNMFMVLDKFFDLTDQRVQALIGQFCTDFGPDRAVETEIAKEHSKIADRHV